jgi:D-alanyl-D-alanine dipeptidase
MLCVQRSLALFSLLIFAFSAWAGRFVEVVQQDRTIVLDIRYATENNFTHQSVYPSARCFLQEDAAKALGRVQEKLRAMGLGLLVFDCYRPVAVQKKFWAIGHDVLHLCTQTPESCLTKEKCPVEDFIANPKKGSRHNRGMAVDCTLIKLESKQSLEMPTEFDDFTDHAFRSYMGCSKTVQKNRALLQRVMEEEGFVGLPSEWWHFDYKGWEKEPIYDLSFEQIDAINAAQPAA